MTVLVTGGNGFVAGWCIAGLLERGDRVRATVRNARRSAATLQAQFPDAGDRLQIVEADLTADAGWPDPEAIDVRQQLFFQLVQLGVRIFVPPVAGTDGFPAQFGGDVHLSADANPNSRRRARHAAGIDHSFIDQVLETFKVVAELRSRHSFKNISQFINQI